MTAAAARLQSEGVRVHLFEDDGRNDTPDAVFPNNWFSTHAGGHVALFPMYSPSRRRERRGDVIELLKARYRVQDVIDYSGLERDGVFLEGTGAMVLDHAARIAYTARSNRADALALERFCTHFNFEPIVFDTADASGCPICSPAVRCAACSPASTSRRGRRSGRRNDHPHRHGLLRPGRIHPAVRQRRRKGEGVAFLQVIRHAVDIDHQFAVLHVHEV